MLRLLLMPRLEGSCFRLTRTLSVLARSKPRKPAQVKNKTITAGTASSAAPHTMNAEEEMWAIVKTSKSLEDFEFFLDEYPDSRFSAHARLKLQQLKRKQNAQPVTASISPSVLSQVPSGERLVAKGVRRIALFPVKVLSSWGNADKYQKYAIESVAEISGEDDKLEFTKSYRKFDGLSDDIQGGIHQNVTQIIKKFYNQQ